MTELPTGYLLRRPRDEDAQALVDLMVAIDIDEQGSPDTEIEDLQADWTLPRFDKARDAWTIASPDRSFVGYGWVWDRVPHLDLQADVHVHPKHRALGLEQALLDRIEERGREHVPVAPAGEKVTVPRRGHPRESRSARSVVGRTIARSTRRSRSRSRITFDLLRSRTRSGWRAVWGIPISIRRSGSWRGKVNRWPPRSLRFNSAI